MGNLYGKRILVLVPHPDDEVVGCSAAIGRAQAEGSQIFALYLTHGCIAQDTLWPWQRKNYGTYVNRRRIEAETVATFLGITPLNNASNWPDLSARYLWLHMEAVFQQIQKAIAQNNIDQIWVPAFEGGNADHDALNAITSLFKGQISILEFAEYNFHHGKAQSQAFPQPNDTEILLTLSPEERVKKRAALTLYESEQQNLNYVKCDRECCRPLASYDYSQMPHAGKLWYARFQWVPFRHPRVDFTNPQDVAKSIQTFLNAKTSALPVAARQ